MGLQGYYANGLCLVQLDSRALLETRQWKAGIKLQPAVAEQFGGARSTTAGQSGLKDCLAAKILYESWYT